MVLGIATLMIYLVLPSLLLVAPAEQFVQRTLKVAVLLVLFWAGLRTVDVVFSENLCYAHRPSNSSFGACMGMQYAPERVADTAVPAKQLG